MKLFLSILFSSLFIAPLMHGMHHAARRELRRQNQLKTLRVTLSVNIKSMEGRVQEVQEKFNKGGGQTIPAEDRLSVLRCAMLLDNTLLAQKIINVCSTDELNQEVYLYREGSERPLITAASVGNKKVVRLLLEAKVNVNAESDNNIECMILRPLSQAAFRGWIDIVDLLLDAGATSEFTPGLGKQRFVEMAVGFCAQCIIECLLDRNLIPEDLANYPKVIEAKKMQDKLNRAVQQDNATEVINCLKEDAYQTSAVKDYIFKKLAALVAKDDLVSLRRLIIQGFPLFICDKQGNTLLHVSVQNSSVRTIGYFIVLLKKIGKLDQYMFKRNNSGRAAIDYAVEDERKQQLFKLFLGIEDSKSELDLNLPVDTLPLPESIGDSNSAIVSNYQSPAGNSNSSPSEDSKPELDLHSPDSLTQLPVSNNKSRWCVIS